MGRTPITQAQWRVVMEGNRSRFGDEPDSDQRPIETVSWHDAMAFCRRLRERTGRYYSLPGRHHHALLFWAQAHTRAGQLHV